MATSLNPPTYPENGTYADLLTWHLYVWRTRPDGSTTQRGEQPWDIETFKEELFQGATADDEVIQRRNKNFNNWTGEGQYVAPGDSYHNRIVEVIFGNKPKFEVWISDLRAAIKRSSPKGNNILSLKVEVAIAALARSGYIPAVVDRSSASNADDSHIAATAEQDTVVIIDKLTEHFVGRSSDIEAIDNFVKARMEESSAQGLMVITAPPGIGKSALAAYWCKYAGKATNRHIVRHFCSMSNDAKQTRPKVIYEHLHKQIADVHGKPVGSGGHKDALTHLLCRAPPDGKELVVWLDGIDEANGTVDCFVPYASGLEQTLGDRVCIIVSARADPKIIPAYLDPWLEGNRAKTHSPKRHNLEKLSQVDVEALIKKLFKANELTAPEGLAPRIYRASEGGWPLFVCNMIDSSIKDIREGKNIDLGESPESLQSYIKVEIKRLVTLTDWHDLHQIFTFLTIAKQAVSRKDLEIILGKEIFPETFPSQLTRWLNVVEVPSGRISHMLSFAHPLLAQTFGQQLEDRQKVAEKEFAKAIAPLSYGDWPQYASRHLPRHLLEMGQIDDAVRHLTNVEFITARFAALGADDCLTAMKADWMAWYRTSRREGMARKTDLPLRNLRFWNNYGSQLSELARQGHLDTWRSLMNDVALSNLPTPIGLHRPRQSNLASSISTLNGHRGPVNGALMFPDGSGFLSWSDNKLHLWDSSGLAREVLHGHESDIGGALALPNGGGFLSWSLDRTLRLWDHSGIELKVMCGHELAVTGALLLPGGSGILSFSRDGTLRLWDDSWLSPKVMRGHEHMVHGALVLPDDSGFLSWSLDGTLRLWDNAGGEREVLRGHKGGISGGGVTGALALPDGSGFLSWSRDNTLRLWDIDGVEREVLRGHDSDVVGALVLPDGDGFLSWGRDCTLRLWDNAGVEREVLRGHNYPVDGGLVLPDGSGFLSWSRDGLLGLWNNDGTAREVLHQHKVNVIDPLVLRKGSTGALVLPDGSGFLSWSADRTLRRWDNEGAEREVLRGHSDGVNGALVIPNGGGFLSWSEDRTLRLWDYEGTEREVKRGHDHMVLGALVLPDSSGFLSWSEDKTLRLWDNEGVERKVLRDHEAPVGGALLLSDGSGFLSWGGDTLHLWENSGVQRQVLYGHQSWIVGGALVLADNSGFLSWGGDTLHLWDNEGVKRKELSGHDHMVHGALVLADGSGFLSWSEDRTLRRWDNEGVERKVLRGHGAPVSGALLLSNGSGFLSWSEDSTLRIWDNSGAERRVLRGHESWVTRALLLPDGAGFLSWGGNTLHLWDSEGEERKVLRGHESWVTGALLLSDGSGFLSWSEDHTLRLWDNAGAMRAVLSGHDDIIRGALALADGGCFLSWGKDGTLRMWDSLGNPVNIWLSPCGEIAHVEPHDRSDSYVIVFGGQTETIHFSHGDVA